MTQFVGVIHKEKDSDYGVSFPDLPGCITAGATMQEAFELAREALQFHIDGLIEDGAHVPSKAITLDQAEKHDFGNEAHAFFVVEGYVPTKPKRINVMLDESLINRIDKVAGNRSAFLAEAALEKLRA